MRPAHGMRSKLPERDRCPRCGTQVGVLAARVHIKTDTPVLIIITHSCPYTARDARRRCGKPYAMVLTGPKATYVFADSFDDLEQELIKRYGPEAKWSRAE